MQARKFHWCILALACSLLWAGTVHAEIEAVKGKKYKLTERHGPWMIMVASMCDNEDATEEKHGPSAQEAADALVYEMRKIGIPAYTYSQQQVIEKVATYDRLGRPQQRQLKSKQDRIVVIAGNYPDLDDPIAQKTLAYIKKMYPKSLQDGNFKKTPGRPGPLSGAFLSINPLLSPEEVKRHKIDPLVLNLNSGMDYSLFENKGKYSLVVASFYGKSVTKVSPTEFKTAADNFSVSNSLDHAAQEATTLVDVLRQRNFDAYVFHERYRSVVTVGSFTSPEDPQIPKLAEFFGAKVKTNPTTGQQVLIAENIASAGAGGVPAKTWIFDPKPTLIPVPRSAGRH